MTRLITAFCAFSLMLTYSVVTYGNPQLQRSDQRELSAKELIAHSLRPHARSNPSLVDAPIYRINAELDLDLFIYRGELSLSYIKT